jgi:hypothetical protein
VNPSDRYLIVFDGKSWFVRHVRVIEHDLDRDEKVYRCDTPLGGAHGTLDEAVTAFRAAAVKRESQ